MWNGINPSFIHSFHHSCEPLGHSLSIRGMPTALAIPSLPHHHHHHSSSSSSPSSHLLASRLPGHLGKRRGQPANSAAPALADQRSQWEARNPSARQSPPISPRWAPLT
ncbi:unnamed protein product [Periconia digitata]|uniref:Uncharacterized protein n=1 Tax=Periconia digitata TaxID=1303443 RepID=A0A9W4U3T8_9PLEO|nr:unnamed protein product [Periconia digitata]